MAGDDPGIVFVFSIRAHVRYTSNKSRRVPRRIMDGCRKVSYVCHGLIKVSHIKAIIFPAESVEQ